MRNILTPPNHLISSVRQISQVQTTLHHDIYLRADVNRMQSWHYKQSCQYKTIEKLDSTSYSFTENIGVPVMRDKPEERSKYEDK